MERNVITPLRVLIVEDNEDHARLACEFLQASGPFVTEIAADLESLWRRLAAESYDVVTLDYNLPDGNGLKALEELAARRHDVAVVMVTGRGDERVATQAIQHGASDYIVKTGDYLSTLAAVVQKAARTHALVQANRRSLEQIRYQALLLNNVHDAVIVWDLDGRITFWNRAAEEVFGWPAATWLGQPAAHCYLTLFQPPADMPPLDGVAPYHSERCGRRRTGEEVWVSSSLSTLRDEQGSVIGYMDVARDITARKRLEAQVQAAQTQLAHAVRLAAIGELASGVAHQISNPLTTIIAETQLLLRALPPGPTAPDGLREALQAIERGGWRAQEAVQRLLDFSRPASATREPVSVNETIDHARALVGGLVEAVDARLEVDLAEGLPPVHGNARQLEDLWVNLLLLARDAVDAASGPARGRPTDGHRICAQSRLDPAGWVAVSVHDNGLPIPAEVLGTIFEPAFVGPVAGRGTGLELSICREIVRQHGGQISVDSVPGRGTTFSVLLPTR